MFIGDFIIFMGAPIISIGFMPSACACGIWTAQAMPIAVRAPTIDLVLLDMGFLLLRLLYFFHHCGESFISCNTIGSRHNPPGYRPRFRARSKQVFSVP
jgi:hypothetical protein